MSIVISQVILLVIALVYLVRGHFAKLSDKSILYSTAIGFSLSSFILGTVDYIVGMF